MQTPSEITPQSPPPDIQQLDMDSAWIEDKDTYEQQLAFYQQRLLELQQAYYHQGLRAIIVFEGWDASGKGGAIRRLTNNLDPRGFQVHPIGKPLADEQGRHYLYRFQTKLPKRGQIAIFDRSWYGRVLVERVESLCLKNEWQRAYQEINEFERLLHDDGVRICKLFLHIDKKEQARRFIERLNNPFKRWKLTDEDLRNREHWDQYQQAVSDMFTRTSTVNIPWQLIPANHKWFARVSVLKTIVETLENDVDTRPPEIDQQLLERARQSLDTHSLPNK